MSRTLAEVFAAEEDPMFMRRRMSPQQRTPEQLARLYATQGRCPKCNVVLTWDSRDVPGQITKGQLACPDCGSVLLRTHSRSPLARVAKNPKPVTSTSPRCATCDGIVSEGEPHVCPMPVGQIPLAPDGHVMRLARGVEAIKAAESGAPLYVFNEQKGWIPAPPGALERAKRSLALSTERGEGTHALAIYGADLSDWTPFQTEREKRGEG